MIKTEENKKFFDHWKCIVNMVFAAENKLYDTMYEKIKTKEVTPDEYIEAIVEEIFRMIDENEINIKKKMSQNE